LARTCRQLDLDQRRTPSAPSRPGGKGRRQPATAPRRPPLRRS